MSRCTEAVYLYWTRRFVRFCRLRHPAELDAEDVRRFLTHLGDGATRFGDDSAAGPGGAAVPVPSCRGPAARGYGSSAEGQGAYDVAGGAHAGSTAPGALTGRPRVLPFVAKSRPENLALLAGLVECGTITPVIDRRFALSKTADAVRRLGAGPILGKVVINIR
jgi:NADPH:quinone reductase-like Zn-dependent oxidoreductase